MILTHQHSHWDTVKRFKLGASGVEGGREEAGRGNKEQGLFLNVYAFTFWHRQTYIQTYTKMHAYSGLQIYTHTPPLPPISLPVAFYTGSDLIIANDTQLCQFLGFFTHVFLSFRCNFSCHLNSLSKWGQPDSPWSSIWLANIQWVQDA